MWGVGDSVLLEVVIDCVFWELCFVVKYFLSLYVKGVVVVGGVELGDFYVVFDIDVLVWSN